MDDLAEAGQFSTPAYTGVDLHGGLAVGRHVHVTAGIDNLFDRKYRLGEYNYESDFHSQPAPTLTPDRHFTAGAPRGIFLTLSTRFGGGT